MYELVVVENEDGYVVMELKSLYDTRPLTASEGLSLLYNIFYREDGQQEPQRTRVYGMKYLAGVAYIDEDYEQAIMEAWQNCMRTLAERRAIFAVLPQPIAEELAYFCA